MRAEQDDATNDNMRNGPERLTPLTALHCSEYSAAVLRRAFYAYAADTSCSH